MSQDPTHTPPAYVEVQKDLKRLEDKVFKLEGRFSKIDLKQQADTLAHSELLGNVAAEVRVTNKMVTAILKHFNIQIEADE